MGLYTPPDKNPNSNKVLDEDSSNNGGNANNNNNSNGKDDSNKGKLLNRSTFYSRPSVGLIPWGPLVPASDCTWGMWALLGIQTAVGFSLLTKFRVSLWKYRMGKTVTKEIADIPSLNRFSTTHGTLKYKPETLLQQANGTAGLSALNQFGGTHTFHFVHKPTRWQKFASRVRDSMFGRWFNHSLRLAYLFSGSILLSLSILELSRLTVFDYDPWKEQMESAREKQFYNDTNQFYREGIDPSKFEVKIQDSKTGKLVDATHDPEIRAHVAMARALMVQSSWLNKWFGPLDLKPLSFKDYLDKIEQYELGKVAAQEAFQMVDPRLAMPLAEAQHNLSVFAMDSEKTRKKTLELLSTLPSNALPTTTVPSTGDNGQASMLQPPDQVKVFPVNSTEPEQIRLGDSWLYNNPWSKLGVETHLGVKIIPSTPIYYEENEEPTSFNESGSFTINNNEKK